MVRAEPVNSYDKYRAKQSQVRVQSAYDVAFKLHTLGFCVIPSGGGKSGKAPLVSWAEYQHRPSTESELNHWETTLHPKLWGMVTGAISGVVVIDADTPETRAELETEIGMPPHVLTPRGGGHYYFKHPGYLVKTTVRIVPQVDIRADGGFVNTVGSRPDGEYTILRLPTPDILIPWEQLPARIRQALDSSKSATVPITTEGTIPEGDRKAHLTSLAGSMRHRGMPQAALEILRWKGYS